MKLTDVEYQLDCNKLTFYYTANKRIDFRELVKILGIPVVSSRLGQDILSFSHTKQYGAWWNERYEMRRACDI